MTDRRLPSRALRTSTVGLIILFVIMVMVGLSNIFLFHRYIVHDLSAIGHSQNAAFADPNLEGVAEKQNDVSALVTPEASTTSTSTSTIAKENTVVAPHKSKNKHTPISADTKHHHPIAGLSCADHGGPSDEIASEMIFWSDIPTDSGYKSPFYDEEKYITFEPDEGGWNNIRMAYETILVLAHAMGRTLVLPPEKGMYLIGKGGHKFTFNDFFHLDSIAMEHEGLNIITMEEFLKRKGLQGQLKDVKTGEVVKPPGGKVDWNGQPLGALWHYLRNVGKYPTGWNPTRCMAGIPASKDPKDVDELQTMFDDIKEGKYGSVPDPEKDFINTPAAVDGEAVQRLREMMMSRDEICIYDAELQAEPILHFKQDPSDNARMLTHFYAFIFFQNWKADLWSKRFVRDHIRYVDEIVCAAARIINAVRERAKKSPTLNPNGEYDSFHVRRGDFQYKKVKVEADVLYRESKEQLKEGGTLYIATDERKKDFFNIFKKHHDVTFLDDYLHLIKGINPNYYGMLDQLVASKGRVFFGTWFSTLSGYINRMRGYYSAKMKLEGYELGTLPSYYFVPNAKKMQMTKYYAVKKPIYMREFPTSWRDIDKGIGELSD